MTSISEIVETSTPINLIKKKEIIKMTRLGLESNYDRVYSWLILFDIYPSNSVEWPSKVHFINEKYFNLVDLFGLRGWEQSVIPKHFEKQDFHVNDPETMSIIHSDILRTSRLLFFLPKCTNSRAGEKDPSDILCFIQEHLRRIERILYINSLLNDGIGYLQGYNELVSPFYILLAKTIDLWNDNLDFVESLCFNMFSYLMKKGDIKEFFTQDKSSQGTDKIFHFKELQMKHLPAVADIINTLNIHPMYYCIRWFSLLFSQEYDLPDLLLVWDCLFSHLDEISEYSFYIGLGQLKVIEPKLSKKDYGKTLSNLQNLNIGSSLSKVINYANQFWCDDHKGFFTKYFSWLGF